MAEDQPPSEFERRFWRLFLLFIWSVPMAAGTITRWADLAQHGLLPYAAAPLWMNVYWTSLAILDPLSILLLWIRPRIGAVLMIAILATDVPLNIYANLVLFDRPLAQVWLILQLVYLVGMIATYRTLMCYA
ncbi:hypothetical protein B5C34_13845 [Pacificimonas flava]|uniref:Uncharacterized protein n=2 Tax=Pacificimonas TaxID=1960290 RepID=A0A219B8F1_9SPHN|nr:MULTISPECIES: hypothetical protein [Pacificimonas]MBZ6379908.1 hypothetical protein [Pacificimonas aurantium]OWV34433.1 hypothetical protein B5C34_13845 [Pacificimonas flava]